MIADLRLMHGIDWWALDQDDRDSLAAVWQVRRMERMRGIE